MLWHILWNAHLLEYIELIDKTRCTVILSMLLTFDMSVSQTCQFLTPCPLYQLLYVPPPPYHYTPLLTFPTSNTICICNPLPFILPSSVSLQGGGITALTYAGGHIEAIKLLLTAPGIDVNHADVSYKLLASSRLVVGGRGGAYLTHLIPHSNPRNDDLSSPNA